MSSFLVPVVRINAIEAIPKANAIELAVVGDYRSVIKKGQFIAGDLAVYLPEGAVLPRPLIEELGLVGRLAGAEQDRIRAVVMRECLSQGILYGKIPAGACEGDSVAEQLGVVKYEPKIPKELEGAVSALFGYSLRFDIENFKAFPDVLIEGEEVEMTEKTHGIFTGIGVAPDLDHPEMVDRNGLVYAKGLGAQGLVFSDTPENDKNVYMQMAKRLKLHDAIRRVFPGKRVHVLGETFGSGVQDLAYGFKDGEKDFAAFDIWVDGHYLDRDDLALAVKELGIARVPVLYRGPFSREIMYEITDGRTVIGNGANIREGVIINPVKERRHNSIGRVILKSVSGAYLIREGDATEYS